MRYFMNYYADMLRKELKEKKILPFIGIYDVFSASIAAKYSNALFVSGFGFAASHYGMPDIGFITWTDMINFVSRIRAILPNHHILVDIDDGYVDIETAKHVVRTLSEVGASGVIMEDQKRPKKCGHCDGKTILELDSYLEKLAAVTKEKNGLYLVARTDAKDDEDILNRVDHFQRHDIDCILVDGIGDISKVIKAVDTDKFHIAYNQIYGGKSVNRSLEELNKTGINVAIYSTPCLFSAQKSICDTLQQLKENDFTLDKTKPTATLKECNDLLNDNLVHRHLKHGA